MILAITALVTVIVIIGFALNSTRQKKDATIDIQVVPSGSTVTLDGKGVSSGNLRIASGEHTLAASKDGFESQTKKFSIKSDENKFEGLALVSNSASTRNWYIDHPEEQRLVESIGSRSFDQSSSEITTRYPIIKELPFIDQFYRVDYGKSKLHSNDPSAIALYVTFYSKEGKTQALKWLDFKGYTPASIEIIYTDKTVD